MKIIIVGGGIAGLSTYLHIRKYLPDLDSHTVNIFESHSPHSKRPSSTRPDQSSQLNLDVFSESTATVGGGLGISPNGMRVLHDLDPGLHARVVAQGFPAENFIFKGANGWTLGIQPTSDRKFRAESESAEVCVASSRHGLWETLLRYTEEKYGDDIVRYRNIVRVERLESGRVSVRWAGQEGNEACEDADLVIGADGVKSVVRKALFGGEKEYDPVYT